MPYKDPAKKKEWEELHRAERLARRRELRQTRGVEQERQPNQEPEKVGFGNSVVLIPIITGGALAAYSPKVGFAVGGLGLVSSVVFKKGWAWWLVSCVVLVVAFLSYCEGRRESELNASSAA
jgi:hypothetical protein